jgi:hypothetical protein
MSPTSAGVAPTATAYNGRRGSMIETPAFEMNESVARIAIERSSSAATAPSRVRTVERTAGG